MEKPIHIEEQKTILVDLDGTLCPQAKKGEGYDKIEPFKESIDTINKLYDKGFKIIIFTSRFMGYYRGDVLSIYRNNGYDYTKKQLEKWGLKFHELHMGKPQSEIIIDDRALFYKPDWKKIYQECIKLNNNK